MKEDLIADLWTLVVEHIPEKQRSGVAYYFVNTLLDYDIKDSVLESLQGIDPYLDGAIEYAIDGEEIEEDEEGNEIILDQHDILMRGIKAYIKDYVNPDYFDGNNLVLLKLDKVRII